MKILPAKQAISFEKNGNELRIDVPSLHDLFLLFGTTDDRLALGLLKQAIGVTSNHDADAQADACGLVMAIIEDFAPKDAVERLMTVQMAATHTSLMAVCAKMNNATTLELHEVYERSLNRLARTFTTQVEALRKHRNGGRSKVTVEHVTVNEGGQAIVGNVHKSSH